MARTKDTKTYDDTKTRLLSIGMELIRSRSFASVGINDVLAESQVPRGSFYHYFASKEAFGLAVAEFYHSQQMASAQRILRDNDTPPFERVRQFFKKANEEFVRRNYADGCLMCNLSVELADSHPAFQEALEQHWRALARVLAECLEDTNLYALGLGHLTAREAADWLLNAWSGALVRMKATRSGEPLKLFEKTLFTTPRGV